jgi:hypothetical protein
MVKSKPALIAALALAVVLAMAASVPAEVEWNVLQRFKLEAPPLDASVSPSGKYLYMLTEKGDLQIYENGALIETIAVGPEVSGIRTGPDDTLLFLLNSEKQSVDVVQLDFIQEINIDGAAFKGDPKAPVALVIFSDFQ